jgi:hypothetical protein
MDRAQKDFSQAGDRPSPVTAVRASTGPSRGGCPPGRAAARGAPMIDEWRLVA